MKQSVVRLAFSVSSMILDIILKLPKETLLKMYTTMVELFNADQILYDLQRFLFQKRGYFMFDKIIIIDICIIIDKERFHFI